MKSVLRSRTLTTEYTFIRYFPVRIPKGSAEEAIRSDMQSFLCDLTEIRNCIERYICSFKMPDSLRYWR